MGIWRNRKRLWGRTVFLQSALLIYLLFALSGCTGVQPSLDNDSADIAEKVAASESVIDSSDLIEMGQSENPAGASNRSGTGNGSDLAGIKQSEAVSGLSNEALTAPTGESGLTIEFIDVGQGDSTLILCEGEAMLIDAGDESSGTNVQNEMEKLGIENLKYLICSHPDADHIGGADVIAYKFPVGSLLMPELERDTKAYEQLAASISERDIKVIYPAVGETYGLGGGSFTIVGPVKQYGQDETNNWSVCLRFTYGELRFLFCGDAEEKAEEDMLAAGVELEADVYHVSHHGSSSSTTASFLQAVRPSYGVVSCGRNNDYGHPHEETKETLAAYQVKLYRTDELGNIFCYSDGKNLNWESEYGSAGENAVDIGASATAGNAVDIGVSATAGNAVDMGASATAGNAVDMGTSATAENDAAEASAVADEPVAPEEAIKQDYVLNINSKKIHLPGCKSIAQIKESNRQEVHAALEDLLEEGYEPCKNCMG